MPDLQITPDEAAKLLEGLDRMERISKEIGASMRQPAAGPINNASFNINAGGWFNIVAIFIMTIGTTVSTTLYLVDRGDHRDEVNRLDRDISDLKADNKDLRDNQTTLQAYVNQLYRDKTK